MRGRKSGSTMVGAVVVLSPCDAIQPSSLLPLDHVQSTHSQSMTVNEADDFFCSPQIQPTFSPRPAAWLRPKLGLLCGLALRLTGIVI